MKIILYTIIYTVLTWTDYGGHSYLTPVKEFKVFESEQQARDFKSAAKRNCAYIAAEIDTLYIK